jgi:hypothetical protein
MNDHELQGLEYTEPRCRFTSEAWIKNEQGQVLRLEVSSEDDAQVWRYLQNVRMNFLVTSSEETSNVDTEQTRYDAAAKQNNQKIELPANPVVITVGIVDAAAVEPPYDLTIWIDPPLGKGYDLYKSYSKAASYKVEVTATGGALFTALRESGNYWADAAQVVDTNASTLAGNTAVLNGTAARDVYWYLDIVGKSDDASYTSIISMLQLL